MPQIGETSHNFLNDLVGKTIMFSLKSFPHDSFDSKLISFDEFTIIVVSESTDKSITRQPVMYYKHALESICEA